MLSGKLSRKLSRKLKKMMFDGPFLIRIAVRPLESTDKQKTIKNITCSILENPRRNRLSGRRAGCFETVQNISAENLSLTKQDRFEIHISTKKYISSKSPQVPGPASRSEFAQMESKAPQCSRPKKLQPPRRCWNWCPGTQTPCQTQWTQSLTVSNKMIPMAVKLMQQGAPDLARASYIAHMNQTWAQSTQTFVIMAAGYLGTDSEGPVTID